MFHFLYFPACTGIWMNVAQLNSPLLNSGVLKQMIDQHPLFNQEVIIEITT